MPLSWRRKGAARLRWTWCFVLRPVDGGRATRFVFRWRVRTGPWWFTAGAHLLIVPADFIMSRGTMRVLRTRVTRQPPSDSTGTVALGPRGCVEVTRRRRPLLIAGVAAFNSLGAGLGAIALAVGWIDLGEALTARLPWGCAVFGAVALGLIVALPNAVLTVAAARGDARCGPLSILTGVLLVGWILVELAFIRELSFLHPFHMAVGLFQVWLGARVVHDRWGITGRELLREAADVTVDLPLFLTAPLYRRWHLTWHATDAEVAAPMPGDEQLPRPAYLSTRAITIDAPPARVWPWLVQVGCLRAGFYSNDLLDNLGHPSRRMVVPRAAAAGDRAARSDVPRPTEATSFRVEAYDVPRELLWVKPDSIWSWRLTEEAPGRTRVVTRIRAVHDWRHPAAGLLSLLLLEFGDFAMLRRMLRGIKHRAESAGAATDS